MNMRKILILIILFFFISCSSNTFLIKNSGKVYLINRDHEQNISCKEKIIVAWKSKGEQFLTRTRASGRYPVVTTTIVRANNKYIKLKSTHWNKITDIPGEYTSSNNNITVHSNSSPYLFIPLDSITTIYKCTQNPNYIKSSATGAAKGGKYALSQAIKEGEEKTRNEDYSGNQTVNEKIVSKTIFGTIAGAIFNPIIELVKDSDYQMPLSKLNVACKRYEVNRETRENSYEIVVR